MWFEMKGENAQILIERERMRSIVVNEKQKKKKKTSASCLNNRNVIFYRNIAYSKHKVKSSLPK